jgi:hypothetical protein
MEAHQTAVPLSSESAARLTQDGEDATTALVPVETEKSSQTRWTAPPGWTGALPAPPSFLALPYFPSLGDVIHLPATSEEPPEQSSTSQVEILQLALEAQQVIWLRMAGMGVPTPAALQENTRMVAEKPTAFAHAMLDGTLALMTGHSPDEAARRSAARLRQVTSANLQRLTE